MLRLIALFFILILFSSCKNKVEKKDSEDSELVEVEILRLADKYNAVQGWDTLDYHYTIQYQELFSDSNKLFLLDELIYITDIKKEKNKYFILGSSDLNHTFYFQFECSKSQVNSLLENGISYFSEVALISKITGIKKLVITVGGETDYHEVQTGEDSYKSFPYSYAQIQEGDDFLLTGKLVDFYIENRE